MSDANKDPAPEGTEPEGTEPEGTEPEGTEPEGTELREPAPAESAAAPLAEDDTPLDAAGRERPRFLLGFPAHPDLSRLSAAFEAGNYALVREEAPILAERAESPAVRAAALELRRRIEPDPLAKYLLALTAALLLLLAYWAYHH